MNTAELVTTEYAALKLGVSPRRVRQLITDGRLPARLMGRDWVIDRADLELVRERKNGRPRKQTPTASPVPELPTPAATLLNSLSTNREPVATVYRRLNWTRKQLTQVIGEHRYNLAQAGLQLHVATHAETGRQERYIEIDGTRYSALSRPGQLGKS